MRTAKLAMIVLTVPLAASAVAQPPPPAAPRCVLMPRQGPVTTPSTARPRDRCAPHAFPRSER